nr:hypothetical protein [Tanacetum cinerariifolium]
MSPPSPPTPDPPYHQRYAPHHHHPPTHRRTISMPSPSPPSHHQGCIGLVVTATQKGVFCNIMSICTQQEPSNLEPAEDGDRLNQLATVKRSRYRTFNFTSRCWHLVIKMEAGTDLAKAHLSRPQLIVSGCLYGTNASFVLFKRSVALSDYDDDLPVKFKRYHVSDTSNKIRMFCLIDEDTDDDDDELSLKFKQTQVVDISNAILNLSLIDEDIDDDAHLRLKFKRSHVNDKIPNVR